MNFENPEQNLISPIEKSVEKTGKQKKEEKLNSIRQNVESWTDIKEYGIDQGIKETVVILNALDIPTSQSCEGHFQEGTPNPWIMIKAVNEPKNIETIEYQQWDKENEKLHKKVLSLLEEFYQSKEADEDIRLKIDKIWKGGFRLYNGPDEEIAEEEFNKLSDNKKSKLLLQIEKRQDEIQAFTEFLKKKYFEEDKK